MKKVKLLAHTGDVHQDTTFYCEHCGQRYRELDVMKEHILAEHDGVRELVHQIELDQNRCVLWPPLPQLLDFLGSDP